MLIEQIPITHVLMVRVHGPRVTGGGERDVRHVKAGKDLHDARNFFRLGLVDGLYKAVRDRRMLDAHEQRLLRRKIVIVFCPPGRLVKSVHAHFAAAYDAHVCYLLFWGSLPAVISGEL